MIITNPTIRALGTFALLWFALGVTMVITSKGGPTDRDWLFVVTFGAVGTTGLLIGRSTLGPVARTAAVGVVALAASVAIGWSPGYALSNAMAGGIGVLIAVAIAAYANKCVELHFSILGQGRGPVEDRAMLRNEWTPGTTALCLLFMWVALLIPVLLLHSHQAGMPVVIVGISFGLMSVMKVIRHRMLTR